MRLTKYLRENYRLLKLIHDSPKTKIFLVSEILSSEKFLLKMINRTGLLYSHIAAIKNAALPEIYHVEECGSTTYVVEEFLQGMDLQEYLDLRGTLDEQTAARLMIKLCDGLQALHKWHIIHRDIKPSNLFLTDAGNLKLIDFDAARMEKPGRFADTRFIGTPGFAAPEQYGFHQTDERTDIYSLGLTFKLLLGYENYRGNLSPVLARCIEFDPNKRFDSAQSLKRAIIRRRRLRHWKKFFVAASIGAVSFGGWYLVPQPAREVEPTPQIRLPVINLMPLFDVQSSAEKIPVEQPTVSDENFAAEEISAPPTNEPTYYALAPQPTKIVPENPAREIDYSSADSPDLQERGIPRKILEHNMSDLPADERDERIDEYQKRMELNSRQKEFTESLPDDMSAEEKNEAVMEFRRRAKASLGLK